MRRPGWLATALIVVAAACARRPAGPMRVAIHNDPISMDPHLQNEILTFATLANVYDALTAFDPELKVVPNLAESWENPDEVSWLFRLRPEARFHDGTPLTADDVVFSIERARHHPKSGLAGYLVEVAEVRAEGDHTVRVVTRRPFGGLLNKLTFIYVVPRNVPEVITSPLGTGAYRFVSFERGKLLRLVPYADDWRSAPARLPLDFLPIREPKERVAALLDGRVDVVQDVPTGDVKRVAETSGLRTVVKTSSILEHLQLSPKEPLFADRRVRLAVSLALDREALVRHLGGFGQPASQMVGAGVFGFDPDIPVVRRDLPRARQLLAEAGHADGIDLTMEFRDGRRGEEIARQLGEAGIRVTLRSGPWNEVFARLRAGQIPFYFGGISAPTADASDVLDSFLHTREVEHGYGATNYNGYSNPVLDELIEASAASRDMAARRGLLQRAMRIPTEDLYHVPLFVPYDLYGMRTDVVWEPRLDRLLLGAEMNRKR